MQEIALARWRGLPAIRGDAARSTLVYRIVLNTALTWRRRLHVPASCDPQLIDDLHSNEPTPPERLDEEQQRALLERGVKRLAPTDRVLLIMHLEGVSYDLIGDSPGLSSSNVGARLPRIRQRLSSTHSEGKRP